jgi:hypothetical protein
MIRTNGEIVPTMPDDEEFSAQQIRDYVAGTPEVVGETQDGFIVFQSAEAKDHGLPVNELATGMCANPPEAACVLLGRVLLAHPDHVAPYWRRR